MLPLLAGGAAALAGGALLRSMMADPEPPSPSAGALRVGDRVHYRGRADAGAEAGVIRQARRRPAAAAAQPLFPSFARLTLLRGGAGPMRLAPRAPPRVCPLQITDVNPPAYLVRLDSGREVDTEGSRLTCAGPAPRSVPGRLRIVCFN